MVDSGVMCSRANCLLLVGIKQEEGVSNKETVLELCKASESVSPNRLSQRQPRRKYAGQDSSGSIGNDFASSSDEWKPSPALSHSPAETNHGTLPPAITSSVPTGDLSAATCLFVPTKVPDPTSPQAANTSTLRDYTCEVCGKTFAKRQVLNQHIKFVHKKIRKWTCDCCAKGFFTKTYLKKHVDCVHKRLRKFHCETCGACFSFKEHLTGHISRVHKNLRNFHCDICGHSFKEGGALTRHVNGVHKNLRSFPCDICGYSFQQNGDLKRHINTVHQQLREFSCAICSRAFTQNSSLKAHLRRLHPDKNGEKPENPS